MGLLWGLGRSSASGGVWLGAAITIGVLEQESWSYKTARTRPRSNSFSGSCAAQGTCDTLINALKLLTNFAGWRRSGWDTCFTGLLEKSQARSWTGPPEVHYKNNHEAVKVGGTSSKKVVKPRFTAPRVHEDDVLCTFIDTSNVGDHMMEASASRRRLARFLPGHFRGSRWTVWEA